MWSAFLTKLTADDKDVDLDHWTEFRQMIAIIMITVQEETIQRLSAFKREFEH